jgi:hypothetical protein
MRLRGASNRRCWQCRLGGKKGKGVLEARLIMSSAGEGVFQTKVEGSNLQKGFEGWLSEYIFSLDGPADVGIVGVGQSKDK